MLKIIAILSNLVLFGWASYMAIVEGFSGANTTDILPILMIFLLPVINIFALILGRDNWIALYFKRKAMEEKKKILEIENQIK